MKAEFKKIICDVTGDICYRSQLENGLTLYVAPNEKTSAHAVFYTDFGSVNSTFEWEGKTHVLPDGMAHFLEHKLFETEDGGDAFSLFAETGADANAYTSFTKTAYVFTAAENFTESLGILLSFVTSPHFTTESVDKEKGIIIEEITMYDDSPDWQCMFGMMTAMYREDNPIAIDIAGDAESVSKATPELLYSIYEKFYSLSNMTLCVSGNVDPFKIAEMCEKLKGEKRQPPKTYFPKEEKAVRLPYVEKKMQVSRPCFNFGVKDLPCEDEEERNRRAAAIAVFSSMLFGGSSEIYSRLYDEGIINKTFCSGYECTDCYAFYAFSGETERVEEMYSSLCEYIENVKSTGFDEEEFETARRVVYASAVRVFENSVRVAEEMSDIGEFLFTAPKTVANITPEYAFEVFCELFRQESYTLSVIKPLDQKGKDI